MKRPIKDDEREFYRTSIVDGTIHHEDIASLLAAEGGPGNYEFELPALRRVILGARISHEHGLAVREAVRANSQAKLFQAEIDRKYFVLNFTPADA